MIYFDTIKDFALKDINFFFIIIEIFTASIMSFVAVLSFSRSKSISSFFLILTSFFLFFRMTARVLTLLHILYIDEIKVSGVSIYSHILEILPYVTLTIALIAISLKKNQ